MLVIDAKRWAIVLLAAFGSANSGGVQAAEDSTPSLTGTGIGVAAGVLPPPGVYGSLQTSHAGLIVKMGNGADTPSKIASNTLDAGLLWVPNVAIFGATYGIGFFQPLREQSLTTSHINQDAVGLANTVINLSTLSWDLGKGLHASIGADLFVKDTAYSIEKSVNVGHNFWTFEPRAALTYINSNWTITSSLLYNINSENTANHYFSGDSVVFDATVLRQIQRWELGAGAEVIQQISDDRHNGMVVPAVLNGHGKGNRARDISLGPVVGYNFGKVDVQVYYKKSVSSANVAAGYEVGVRASFPISTSGPVSETQLNSVGKR